MLGSRRCHTLDIIVYICSIVAYSLRKDDLYFMLRNIGEVKIYENFSWKYTRGSNKIYKYIKPQLTPSRPNQTIRKYIKGIINRFWIYNISFVPQRKKLFLWNVRLDITTLTRNDWKKMVLKVSPCYIYIIYNSTWSDWIWAP